MRFDPLVCGVTLWLSMPLAGMGKSPVKTAPEIVHDLEAAVGKAQWDGVKVFRFDFVAEMPERSSLRVKHLWDRASGRYRVEWNGDDDVPIVVLMNVIDGKGTAYRDGRPATDSASLVQAGYKRFIDDTYWLLAPFKLSAPGVKTKRIGRSMLDGQPMDVLRVTLPDSKDVYWYFIDTRSGLPARWAFFTYNGVEAPSLERASAWTWSDWREVGGMRFSVGRTGVGNLDKVYFPVLAVFDTVEDDVFTDPLASIP